MASIYRVADSLYSFRVRQLLLIAMTCGWLVNDVNAAVSQKLLPGWRQCTSTSVGKSQVHQAADNSAASLRNAAAAGAPISRGTHMRSASAVAKTAVSGWLAASAYTLLLAETSPPPRARTPTSLLITLSTWAASAPASIVRFNTSACMASRLRRMRTAHSRAGESAA
eukprot:24500-Pleurochrysis_carterae.AAC.1